MTNMPESGSAPGDPSKSNKPPRPKRGAFPTPKSEIDKAKPYIPDSGQEDDPESKSEPPMDVNGEKES